jgi:hypothetical protein
LFILSAAHRRGHHPAWGMTLPVACGVVIVGLASKEDKT